MHDHSNKKLVELLAVAKYKFIVRILMLDIYHFTKLHQHLKSGAIPFDMSNAKYESCSDETLIIIQLLINHVKCDSYGSIG